MTWSVAVQNNSGRTSIAPSAANLYVEGQQAVVTVVGLGLVQLLDVGHQNGGPHYWAVRVTSGSFSQLWWYDGQGACTLTLNGDGTFTLTGQGQTLGPAPVGGTVPPQLALPPGMLTYVTAFTNALYIQRITLTTDGGPITQWQGTGEQMEIASTRFTTPAGSGSSVNSTVLMEYSPDGGASWQRSQVSPVGIFSILSFNQRTVVSEDASDYDWNDSALVLSWWVPPPPGAQAQAQAPAATPGFPFPGDPDDPDGLGGLGI